MKVRRKLKALIAMLACVVTVLGSTLVTQAAGESGILWNGTGGIYIDINAYPYTYYKDIPEWGKWAYTEQGCAWFATSRATQITGIQFPTIYSGSNWFNNAYSYYGFSRGQEIRENALACYDNHVAVVEKIQGNQVIISEGGYLEAGVAHGYTAIRTRNLSDMGSAGTGGNLLGYVYLTNEPVTVSLTWGNEDCQWDTTNAYMYAEADTNVSGSFTEAGITVWNETGDVVVSKSENPGLTGTHLNVWYNITNDTGVVLEPGTNYTYQFYTVFNGIRYESSVRSFRTNPDGPAVNSWTQELSISDWTYGQEASVPFASAQYGEVVYTYSTEEDGEYTAVVPQSAGTYYVKASVAGTDQYTGLEAIKEFHINKAVPVYTVPENITAIYGQTLADIALEDHFAWMDNTESVGDVGEKSFLAAYVPEDSDNYSIVNNIEIPVIVQPKDLSDMNLSGVDEDTDLDSYEIKDGDTVLVKDTDYTITSVKDGKQVTVTVEFMRNYTGTVQTTYLLKDDNQDQTEDKNENGNNSDSGKNTDNKNTDNSKVKKENNEAKAPKTGDVSPIAVWTVMIAVSGLVVKMVCKKRMINR